MKTIEQILQQTNLFRDLSIPEIEALAKTTLRLEIPTGSIFAQAGEVGEVCYIIVAGSVQVYSTGIDGKEIVLARCEPGEVIGERALLPGSGGRRTASLRAYSDVTLLEITKEKFQRILDQDHPLKENLLQRSQAQMQNDLLKQSAVFRALPLDDPTVTWYRSESFPDGQVIFHQGDPGDRVYLIIAGAVDVYEAAGEQQRLIRQLGPGRAFGERALLEQISRTATVIARGDLHVLSIDGAYFLQLYDQQPELRQYMQRWRRLYSLGGRGFANQYQGQWMGKECLTTVSSLVDGRTATISLVIGEDIFNIQVATQPDEKVTTLHFRDPGQHIERTLLLSGQTIVGASGQGYWDELGKVYRMVLEQTSLTRDQVALFQQQGALQQVLSPPTYHDQEVICTCLQLTCGKLRTAIAGGCYTTESLMETTGAGTVCGSCRVMLSELIGRADWTPVRLTGVLPVVDGIRSFRFTAANGQAFKPAKPGQHVLVQAHIGGRWIQRPYTISSAAQETSYREITVKRLPQGVFSNWLFQQQPEEVLLRLSEPQGEYYADLTEQTPIVCLVGGIGMTPALAMCRSLIRASIEPPICIDYSVSTPDQFAYASELQATAQKSKNLHLNLRATTINGRLSAVDVQQLVDKYPHAHYYICGPNAYQQTAVTWLREATVPANHIHVEEFTPVGGQPVVRHRAYLYIGLLLLLAFTLQDVLSLKWPWLETIQGGESYKRWSGLVLSLYIAAQFVLPVMRWRGNLKAAARHYQWHKAQGALAPLVYYLHSTQMGYGYLFVLSIAYLTNFLIGLLNQETIAPPKFKLQYSYYWLIVHTLLSVVTVGLLGYHIYIAFAYQ